MEDIMKTEKNIFIAFILNLAFSVFEFFGGIFTGSVAILSDAVHDLGDAASIGLSFFLEKKSKRQADENYTYGYVRYSVLGSVITTLILMLGSVLVISGAIWRIINPTKINYDGMIVFAIFGVCVNLVAAFFTNKGESLNQRAVNLHMLEDVFGWAVVLFGAVVMKFTDISLIDPIMSVVVAVFILINAIKNLRDALDIFLEKAPRSIDVGKAKTVIEDIDGVIDVHHIHIRSIDERTVCATMHIVTNEDAHVIKEEIRKRLGEHGIGHVTLELETTDEFCHEKSCSVEDCARGHHHHHH